MISNRPMVPMLTHVDNLGDLNLDMSTQEEALQQIADNTATTNSKLDSIRTAQGISQSIESNINQNTNSLSSSVGSPADESTDNTVIGLLKSISNKL